MLGFYAAITRQDLSGEPRGGFMPDQRLTLEEALRAFTAGSANASFHEDQLGVLRTGMQCDVSVFDRDFTRTSAHQIARAQVLATVIAVEVVFARSN